MALKKSKPIGRISWLINNPPKYNRLSRPINFQCSNSFLSSSWIPRRSNSLIWRPIAAKPVAAFWGDFDRDGIYNGLDCAPRNKYKQGPQHKRTGAYLKERYANSAQFLKDVAAFEKKYNAVRAYEKLKEKHGIDDDNLDPRHTKRFYKKEHEKMLKEVMKEDTEYAEGLTEWKRRQKEYAKKFNEELENQSGGKGGTRSYRVVEKGSDKEIWHPTMDQIRKMRPPKSIELSEDKEDSDDLKDKYPKKKKIIQERVYNPLKVRNNIQNIDNDSDDNMDEFGNFEIDE